MYLWNVLYMIAISGYMDMDILLVKLEETHLQIDSQNIM